jgi:hypothetical protein
VQPASAYDFILFLGDRGIWKDRGGHTGED